MCSRVSPLANIIFGDCSLISTPELLKKFEQCKGEIWSATAALAENESRMAEIGHWFTLFAHMFFGQVEMTPEGLSGLLLQLDTLIAEPMLKEIWRTKLTDLFIDYANSRGVSLQELGLSPEVLGLDSGAGPSCSN